MILMQDMNLPQAPGCAKAIGNCLRESGGSGFKERQKMSDALSEMLASRDWLLADGATRTNLLNMGLASGDAPELWNVDEPDKIRALYRGAVDAGSDLFLTNTFGGNASRLKLHNAQSRVHELNPLGAKLGREIADASGRKAVGRRFCRANGRDHGPDGTADP